MRNIFRRKLGNNYNPLSATFRPRSAPGQSNLIVTLDDALGFIERKNQEKERREANPAPKGYHSLDAVFHFGKMIATKDNKRKGISLPKISIQNKSMED